MKSWRIVKFCVQLGYIARALWRGDLVVNEHGVIFAPNFTVKEPGIKLVDHLPMVKIKLKRSKPKPEVAESVVAQ